MFFGTVPLGDHPGLDALSFIKDPNYNPLGSIADQYTQLTPNAQNFLQLCLYNNWKSRATIKELKNHPFIAKKTRKSTLFEVCDVAIKSAQINHQLKKN
jgi:hypothetical protein